MFRLNVLSVFCFIFSVSLFAERLDLSSGAMTAGGVALIRYTSPDFKLGIATNWGFFLSDGFALIFDMQLSGKFSAGFDVSRLYQLGSGVLYAFDLDTDLYPYVQFLAYGAYVETGWSAGMTPMVGLLVGISSQVALDFGLNAKFDFPVSRPGGMDLDIGMGYFGVRAFF